jgi:uncharacterized protein (DUF1810 family)
MGDYAARKYGYNSPHQIIRLDNPPPTTYVLGEYKRSHCKSMDAETGLKRFIDAQREDYAIALSEIKNGRKVTHWMWYIFPQIRGLGFSEISGYYAIKNIREADEFLKHPVLGNRLTNICQALLDVESDAHSIFGSPDDLKLKSSMTLFASLPHANPIFHKILDKFFGGAKDQRSIEIIESQ